MTPAEFEQSVDKAVERLQIFGLPSKCIFGAVFGVIDNLFNGKRFSENIEPRIDAGCALIGRLSYMAPLLLTCDSTQIGSSALDTQQAYFSVDSDGEQLKLLQAYGHFCEIMPEVHRGYYKVIECTTNRLRLEHSSPEFRHSESLDIILSDLALPYLVRVPTNYMNMFDRQAEQLPKGDSEFLNKTLEILFNHHATHTFEVPILSSTGFLSGVGVSYEEFKRFRAAWFAFADYCLGMAAAISRLGVNDPSRQEQLLPELFEWQTINFKEYFCKDLIIKISNIHPDSYEKILSLYSFYTNNEESDMRFGDGFFPPFIRYKESICFNPNTLQIMLSERNIPYVLNKIDRKRFDGEISEYMEPQLISIAVKLLKAIGNWVIVENKAWAGGEFDILVYAQHENVVLHIQAKSAIPAQGARMIKANESRIKEGLRQLRVFREKPQSFQDSILSKALGLKVCNALVLDSVLSRSSFGTHNLWSELDNTIPLSPTILLHLVRKYKDSTQQILLTDIKNEIESFFEFILDDMCPIWSEAILEISDKQVLFPLLEFDANNLSKLRERLWNYYAV
ncbi:MAG: hypothetical protein WC326_12840 [Candidatus Delongbacteria bacterium]